LSGEGRYPFSTRKLTYLVKIAEVTTELFIPNVLRISSVLCLGAEDNPPEKTAFSMRNLTGKAGWVVGNSFSFDTHSALEHQLRV